MEGEGEGEDSENDKKEEEVEQMSENEDDDVLDDDEFEYEVFYDQEQLRKTFKEQKKDIFSDVNLTRKQVFLK